MLKHKITAFALVLTVLSLLSACQASGDFPGREYMPDMGHSQAYESYVPADRLEVATENGETIKLFEDGKVARKPVAGTVARGHVPYHFEDTEEERERAGRELVNPFNDKHTEVQEAAKANYTIYCAICHGEKGDGQGTLITNGVYPAPPPYTREDILVVPEGRMFHSIHYGKNLMGGYSSQLTKEERWQLVSFIKQLQAEHIAKTDKIEVEDALKMIVGNMSYTPGAAGSAEEAPAGEETAEE